MKLTFDKDVKLEKKINKTDDNDIGYFLEVDLPYTNNIKEKTKNFPFVSGNNKIVPDNFATFMNKNKPITYTQTMKLLCDWSDEKNYLIHYRMLKFCVRHGLAVIKFIRQFHLNQANSWKNI